MAKMTKWAHADTVKLISLYEKHSNLYDTNSKMYHIKHLRDESYRNILADLNKPEFSIPDIKSKIKTLRTQFARQQAVMDQLKDEFGPTAECIPKLWCYDKLKFLETYYAQTKANAEAVKKKLISPKPTPPEEEEDYELEEDRNLDENEDYEEPDLEIEAIEFDQTKITNLLKLIKERPGLFNPKHNDYSNPNSIERLWQEISDKLEMSVETIKTKWDQLQLAYSRFIEEKRKGRIQKWYLEELMSFSKPFLVQSTDDILLKMKTTTDLLEKDPLSPTTSETYRKRRALIIESPLEAKLTKSMLTFFDNYSKQTIQTEINTADELFFKSISKESQLLSEQGRRTFKMSVQSMLYEMIQKEQCSEEK